LSGGASDRINSVLGSSMVYSKKGKVLLDFYNEPLSSLPDKSSRAFSAANTEGFFTAVTNSLALPPSDGISLPVIDERLTSGDGYRKGYDNQSVTRNTEIMEMMNC
jgi:hypothetical protein